MLLLGGIVNAFLPQMRNFYWILPKRTVWHVTFVELLAPAAPTP